jgi:hypothetical protein
VVQWDPLSALLIGEQWLDNYVLLSGSVLLTGFVAGVIGSYGFALSMVLCRWSRKVASWVAPARSIEEGKGFVRIHVTPDELVLHPIVIEKVCHDWELKDVGDGMARPLPADPLPAARLIEPPVTIARTVGVRA